MERMDGGDATSRGSVTWPSKKDLTELTRKVHIKCPLLITESSLLLIKPGRELFWTKSTEIARHLH
jgi:hypothetical protein